MNPTRRALLTRAATAGALLSAGTALAGPQEAEAATTLGAWVNVKTDFNAIADDATDAQPAIQRAVDSVPQGTMVYVPPGKYRLGSPIVVSDGVTLLMDWAPHFAPRTDMTDSYLCPTGSGFNGTALIIVNPVTPAGVYNDSAKGGGPRLKGLPLAGHWIKNAAGNPIDAVYLAPGVKDVAISDSCAWGFTGTGFNAQDAAGVQFSKVVASTNHGHGFAFGDSAGGGGMTDVDLFQCYSQANGLNGFDMANPNAAALVDCRAEWNSGHGFNIAGLCYSLTLTACNTDRSGLDGYHISTLPGSRPVYLTACLAKRDGRSSALTSSGINIAGQRNGSVILTGSGVHVGGDDVPGGALSPAYAITAASLAVGETISVNGGMYLGTKQALNDPNSLIAVGAGAITGVVNGTGTQLDADHHTLAGPAGSARALEWRTRGAGTRWTLQATPAPERGGNAGSDLALNRYDDHGHLLDTPFAVSRATGQVSLGGDLAFLSPGHGLRIREGANARMGTVRLRGASAVNVATTAVTGSSRIFLTVQAPSGAASGTAFVASRSAGHGFQVKGHAGDTSLVAWVIVEPA